MNIDWKYLCGTNGRPIERCYIDPTGQLEKWEITPDREIDTANAAAMTGVLHGLYDAEKIITRPRDWAKELEGKK